MTAKIPKQTGLDRWLLNWFKTYGTIKAVGLVGSLLISYGAYRDIHRANIDKAAQEQKETQQKISTMETAINVVYERLSDIDKVVTTVKEIKQLQIANQKKDSINFATLYHNDSLQIIAIEDKTFEIAYLPNGKAVIVEDKKTKEVKKKKKTNDSVKEVRFKKDGDSIWHKLGK
jgi:hypothetical protein